MKAFPRPLRTYRALAALSVISLGSLACSSTPDNTGGPDGTGGAQGQAGSSAMAGSSTVAGSGPGPIDPGKGGRKLRVLTRFEYTNSLKALLGTINTELTLPEDLSKDGFTTIGGAEVAINSERVPLYEAASRAAAAEVFADSARWQALVGCQPQPDLSDACVETFIKTFGKRAFRRDLDDTELGQWVKVARDAAQLLPGAGAALGLETVVSGLLQSPYFLYRIETNHIDPALGRFVYDGPSMATRLSFLLTGSTPSDALLADAAAGKLNTVEGVKAAAAALLNEPGAVDGLASFFHEFSQADLVNVVEKSPAMFPGFNENAALKSSMIQATQLFIKNIVLAPGADVRSFFDSDQTFIDANLAPIYGVAAPASGFMQIKLGPETGRAGILGQAAVLAGHSQPDHNSPTRRGVFIASSFLCIHVPSPPDGVVTTIPPDPTKTERQRLDAHRTVPSCAGCHSVFDPLGFGLEHFDSIGKYRADEHGLPIDATGTLDGVAFDGAAQMGNAFRQSANAMNCMMSNFYRAANGRLDASADAAQIEALAATLAAKGYVWRDLVAEFVASDAFRSAPAAPVTAGNQ